jgi:hypothetical protein
MDELKKVRVLQNDGVSQLIQVEDEYGSYWAKRSRVHLVDGEYILTTERQAQLLRKSIAHRKKREALRIAKERLAQEAESKSEKEVAAEVAA